jgi:hypothetical protein
MPPSKNRDGIATNVAAPAELKSRDAMIGDLLGKLARRAGSWGWLSTYERVRRGESVPAWHYRMMVLTSARRSGQIRCREEHRRG